MMAPQVRFYVLITLWIVGWVAPGLVVAEERWGPPRSGSAASGYDRGSGDDKLGRRFGRFMGSFMDEMDRGQSRDNRDGDAGPDDYARGRSDGRPRGGGVRRSEDYGPPDLGDRDRPRYTGKDGDVDAGPRVRSPDTEPRERFDGPDRERRPYRDFAYPDYDPWGAGPPHSWYSGRRWSGYGRDTYPYDPWGAYAGPDSVLRWNGSEAWGGHPYADHGWGRWGGAPSGEWADPLARDPWSRGGDWWHPGRSYWQDSPWGAPWSWGGGSWFW
ncbi:MAG: hypothetical protein HQL66_05440 [Magnetococcales bacterium]|nr:hypothetical protein [Magnetococcales bacterium]